MHRCVRTQVRIERGWPALVREIGLLAVLYADYTTARLFADDNLSLAREHARELLRIESVFGLDIESAMNAGLSAIPVLEITASYAYATLHYLVTPAVLVLLWLRAPDRYVHWRRMLVIATVIALICYLAYPTAPPRFEPGFVDTLATTSHWGWWGADASAPRGFGASTNELAAMPSMHVGWALWSAWALSSLIRSPRLLVLIWAYPVVMCLVIIATANHWLLDAVVGAALVGFAAALVRPWAVAARQPVSLRPRAPDRQA